MCLCTCFEQRLLETANMSVCECVLAHEEMRQEMQWGPLTMRPNESV